MRRRALAFCAVLALLSSVAFAQRPPFPPADFFKPILNPDNGHYYEIVHTLWGPLRRSTEIDFEVAMIEAASRTHLGMPGHLVTITTPAEQEFLVSTFGNPWLGEWLWIGASDALVEGEWRWVTGPEAGELFWLGNHKGTAVGFESWGFSRDPATNDEPNNRPYQPRDPLGEDYAAMAFFGPDHPSLPDFGAVWNDVSRLDRNRYLPTGYIIEYSPVPEPAASVLLLVGSLVVLNGRRKLGIRIEA